MATTGAAQNDQVCLRRWVGDGWQQDDICLAADVLAESRMPGPFGSLLADAAASYFIAIDTATVADAPQFAVFRLRYAGVSPSESQVSRWCRPSEPGVPVECMIPTESNVCTLLVPAGDRARVFVASASATQILRPVGTSAQLARVVRAQGDADPERQLARGAALFCHLADYQMTPTSLFEHWQLDLGLSTPIESAPIPEVIETLVALARALEIDNDRTLEQHDRYAGIMAWDRSTPEACAFAQARIEKAVAANRALGTELADARRRLEALLPQCPELAAFLPIFEIAFPAINEQAKSRDWSILSCPSTGL